MTQTASAYTTQSDSLAAGRDLAEQVVAQMGEGRPDALVVFTSAQFDYEILLEALQDGCEPKVMVGASSAGEFARGQLAEGAASALAISAPEMRFSATLGTGIAKDHAQAARDLVAEFEGVEEFDFPYRSALVLTDSLAGHTDALIEELTVLTGARYQFAGGGAGDNIEFARTHVFFGAKAYTDAAVALEVLSHNAVGIGVSHGWGPGSEPHRVTEAEGRRLISLNGRPAADVFEKHAAASGQNLDRDEPLPFFLHNVLGIETDDGHRLRVPLSIEDDGSVVCAAAVPAGVIVRIMKTTSESAVDAAAAAVRSALGMMNDEVPSAALFFDCPASRFMLGEDFELELGAVEEALGDAKLVGCNTYGQIARSEGQFNGFHNCTPTVFILPS